MEYDILFYLCLASFFAGFVDAILGGGGLIQIPVALLLLPNMQVSTIIGTLKIPAFTGTSFAAYQYQKKVLLNWKVLLPMACIAFLMAVLGSLLLISVNNDFMKPILIAILFLIAIYTFFKKNLGAENHKVLSRKKTIIYAVLISLGIGFYDGFIGPGTGSFLVISLIVVMHQDFLSASANAKIINLATNFGSILLFIAKGKIIWALAVPMAICNAFGGWLGAKTAIRKGNSFIRILFLVVVSCTLLRLGYDVFIK